MVSSDIGGAAVDYDVPLAPLTSFRVGPVAARLITCDTTDKVVAALTALRGHPGPLLVLAGGSNVLVADDLPDLTVVLLANTEITVEGNVVRAEAGIPDDQVIQTCIAMGWPDDSFPANAVVSTRKPVDEAAVFRGFDD